MKNLFIIFTTVLSVSAFAQSREYGMGGCGLGSLIFKDDTATSAQVLAVTTNGTSMNQVFGVSSGTSGCVETDDMLASQKDRIQYYVDANNAALQKEAAQGSGETLAGLSEILGCPSQDFNRVMKSEYKNIFGNQSVSQNATVENILKVLQKDSALAKACS